jgi:hypothetical protein
VVVRAPAAVAARIAAMIAPTVSAVVSASTPPDYRMHSMNVTGG